MVFIGKILPCPLVKEKEALVHFFFDPQWILCIYFTFTSAVLCFFPCQMDQVRVEVHSYLCKFMYPYLNLNKDIVSIIFVRGKNFLNMKLGISGKRKLARSEVLPTVAKKTRWNKHVSKCFPHFSLEFWSATDPEWFAEQCSRHTAWTVQTVSCVDLLQNALPAENKVCQLFLSQMPFL